jgi:hypothetical protein
MFQHTFEDDAGDSSQALLAFPGGSLDISAFRLDHEGGRTPTTITTDTGIVLATEEGSSNGH